jgi:hypothetical protein
MKVPLVKSDRVDGARFFVFGGTGLGARLLADPAAGSLTRRLRKAP